MLGNAKRKAVVAIVFLLLSIGCGAGDAPTDAVSQLRIAVPQDVGPLNIFAQHDEPLTELVYDKLLAPSPYVDEPQPWLAERVVQRDSSTWEVTVRDGVTWHDGAPFTAEDVKFTFDYFLAAPTGRWTHHISQVPQVDTVEVVDERTLRLGCAYPCPFLGSVTLADLPILPQHIWKDVPGNQAATVTALPVGTGPYKLVDYSTERGYRFEANQDYFAGAPDVDVLIMPVIEDPSATFTALRSGEIDVAARRLPAELLDEFGNAPDIALIATDPLQFAELRLNYQRAPFNLPEFRHAFSLAVDRQALLETILLGKGRPGTQGYPHPDSPWTNPENTQPFDQEESRRMLDDLGFTDRDRDGIRENADGKPLAFTIKVAGTRPPQVRAAELIVEQLAKVGIALKVQTLDPASIDGLFASRDFDISLGTITAHGVADPTQFIMSHRSGYLWNLPKIPYPEMEALMEAWMQANTIEERTAVSFEMQALFNRQPTSVVLYYPEETWAYRPDAYDDWVESPGYGIVHKWSFLSPAVRAGAHATVEERP